MQHIYNYIIKLSKEFNDTFKTESGIELYGDKDFSQDRLSNRYAVIIGQPLLFDGELLELETKVLIDPTVYYHSIHGEDDDLQLTTNTIDRQKGIYSIEPENIVLYKKEGKWFGYLDNFLGKCVFKKKQDKVVGGIILELGKNEKTNQYEIVYPNKFLSEHDANTDDVLYMKPKMGVSVWIDGKEFTWLRNSEVLGKMEFNGN